MEQQRAAYAVKGVDESEPAQAGKKRKKQVYTNGEDVRTKNDPTCPPAEEASNHRELIFDV